MARTFSDLSHLLPVASQSWAHPGLAVLNDGRLVTSPPAGPGLLIVAPEGSTEFLDVVVVEAHGLAVTADSTLWVADIGVKASRRDDGSYEQELRGVPGVLECDLEGRILRRLPAPEHPAYAQHRYLPTAVAPDPQTGGMWVADGYGAGLLHRYDATGAHVAAVSAGIAPFSCPHDVVVDPYADRVLVADRGNGVVQVLDRNGAALGTLGAGVLRSPSGLAVTPAGVAVAELDGGVVLFDAAGHVVERFGEVGSAAESGWPHALDPHGKPVRPAVPAGALRAPHAIARSQDGTLYVAEWLLGGRLTGWQ